MGETELNLMTRTVAAAIAAQVGIPEVRPGKHDLWLTFVCGKAGMTEPVLPGRRLVLTATTGRELLFAVAREVVLAVFGDLPRVVEDLPNLAVRLLDRRGEVRLPGAPPPEREGQIWLKVVVRPHEPGLWQRLFGGRDTGEAGDGAAVPPLRGQELRRASRNS